MNHILLHFPPEDDLEVVWQDIEEMGAHPLFSSQDADGTQQIACTLPSTVTTSEIFLRYPQLINITPFVLETDWNAQWAAHGQGYSEGVLHIDIKDYIITNDIDKDKSLLRMKPGPGFGDLSHPTTRLVLSLMGNYVPGKHVLDVGCGSGILSLAAISLNAKSVVGIDIDEQAITHACENALLNNMGDQLSFKLPENYCREQIQFPEVILMNMIQTEQCLAWNSLAPMHDKITIAITSGILVEERQSYLDRCHQWGWQLIQEQKEDEWLGFVFHVMTK